MLRKDVKLGFAIGGIMLAVLIVYVLVVPSSDKKQGVQIVDESGKTDKAADKPTDKSNDKPQTPVDPKLVDNKTNDTKSGDKLVDNKTDQKGIDPQVVPPVDTAKADGATSNAAASLWDDALNHGKLPPAMMTQTPDVDNKGRSVVPAGTQEKSAVDVNPKMLDAAGLDPNSPEVKRAVATGKLLEDHLVDTTPADKGDKGADSVVLKDKTATDPTALKTTGASRTHVVQAGETLTSIAIEELGDARQWKRIAEANPNVNPNRLKLNSTLNLPEKIEKAAAPSDDNAVPASATTPGASIDSSKQYEVQPNDSLYSIAMKLYGKGSYFQKIYDLNKDTIGANPAKLKLHMVLKLPEAPTAAH